MITFESTKISPTTYRIVAPGMELMYLVVGETKAALIDTGSGLGFLRKYVESLTDKPVTVLITHGHVDHAMGAGEFDEVYMNLEDEYIYKLHADMKFREDGLFLSRQVPEREEIIPSMPISKMKNMTEGDSFDLGGIHIDIYALPGHTRGSLVMLIREERALMLGDACNCLTYLYEPYSLTVSEYKASLERLKPLVEGKFDKIYLSHGPGSCPTSVIDGVITVCDDIMNGNTDDVPFGFKDSRGFLAKAEIERDVRVDGGIGNVIYNKDRIF